MTMKMAVNTTLKGIMHRSNTYTGTLYIYNLHNILLCLLNAHTPSLVHVPNWGQIEKVLRVGTSFDDT